MNDLISRKAVLDIINRHRCDTARIEEGVINLPTAHDIDKVVEELENRASLRDKMALSTTDVDERYNSYIKSADVYRQVTSIMKGAVKDE